MIFKSFDGKELTIHEWTDVTDPVGVVQIAHGMVEHARRYDEFARKLNRIGYIVVADDHRGHGETDKDSLGYCEGDMFTDTVKDLAAIAAHYREKYKGLKYVLFGFSYGSFLTQAFLARYSRLIDGAIVGGSAYQSKIDVTAGRIVAALGTLFKGEKAPARLIEKLTFGSYKKKFAGQHFISEDEGNVEAYERDPYCSFICSNRFYASFFKGLSKLYSSGYTAKLDKELPVLVISGDRDPVGKMGKAVRKLDRYYRNVGMKRAQLYFVEGSRHEFLNEGKYKDDATEKIVEFLKEI